MVLPALDMIQQLACTCPAAAFERTCWVMQDAVSAATKSEATRNANGAYGIQPAVMQAAVTASGCLLPAPCGACTQD